MIQFNGTPQIETERLLLRKFTKEAYGEYSINFTKNSHSKID
ncbi:hypothetical protein J2S05_000835 [Alkalicoccobacillus murimartini]|uniref:Uncharacterized protein n=1 Tax=Alkalicoccobacillus murimartini TaxID=171685 RepID=A0ABT9YDY8_9BACI|nr:hypothetical protein [Alkalicoccobacillus murimartini]